jgi:hypothetical protein
LKQVNVPLPEYSDNMELVIVDKMKHELVKWYNTNMKDVEENYGIDDYIDYASWEQFNNYCEWKNLEANKK